MSAKDRLIAALQSYADSAGDLMLRVMFGTPGSRIEVNNVTEETGQSWTTPGYMDGFMHAIGAVMDQWVKDEFTVVDPLQVAVTLTATPVADASLLVFRDGLLMQKVDTPASATEYSVSGTTVTFLPGAGLLQVHYLGA